MHVLSHVIRTRNLIISNKLRLNALREKGELSENEIELARDQGLARPKVLILCPMRKNAFEIVELFRRLIFGDSPKPFVLNRQRFITEFKDNGYRISEKRIVSDEYRELMSGNNDDCFRLGIGIAKKSLKLFVPFEKSDIIIASPLGLRMIVGDEAERVHEFDFLSSIEVLIIDMADVIIMQNWEHLLHIIDSLHMQPENIDQIDISRVRMWSLNNYSKLYRQTILFASKIIAEFEALFAMKCYNFAGSVILRPEMPSLLDRVVVPLCQELHRLNISEPENQSDERYAYFKDHLLPNCEAGCLIFIPSYYDFVRVRNHLKRSDESFVQLHEYAKEKKIARARDLFFHGARRLLLMTERFYYFRRYRIKGIKSVVMYQPPVNQEFYYEIVNMSGAKDRVLSRMVYNKFDIHRMLNIFGNDAVRKVYSSTKDLHLLVSK
ncbi:hypothetical protein AB6A40_008925 [Gnathostoma spinigerum]|uniref:U3 small nucleolar RNA-associated protein 25 homolog n=1 Tax=Gnathostoma spinigerum TaxID=75299 RepID=A0ABD6ESB4_9BILA